MIIDEKDLKIRREKLKDYAIKNSSYSYFTNEEIEHIVGGMESIYLWYEHDCVPGHFIREVLRNDLRESLFRADDTNRKALLIYVYFIYWELPGDYRLRLDKI